MDQDIVATYFPTLEEIPDTKVRDVRTRLETYMRRGWPELDMQPGSPYGDLCLTPMAYLIAASEIAMDRFTSDLDLENVANGVIWSCPFVERYLNNFAVRPTAPPMGTGMVRLTVSQDKEYELDAGTRFRFGEGNTYNLRLPHDGPLIVRKVGSPLSDTANEVRLVDAGDQTYFLDVPVTGLTTTAVEAWEEGEIDRLFPELQTVTTTTGFHPYEIETSLSALAKKTRDTVYSATPTSRGGTRHFLLKEFPSLVTVSPVLGGDQEMIGDGFNALGIRDGSMDVYVRGPLVTETQIIRLPFIPSQNGTSVQKFAGALPLAHVPYRIDSITAVEAPDLVLDNGYGTLTVLSQSKNPARAPLAQAAYSPHESLWVAVDMPLDPVTGVPLIPTDIDAQGNQSAAFLVQYRYDPLVSVVDSTLSNPDQAGLNVLTRSFIPIWVQDLVITYVRKRGTEVRLEQAATEIHSYLNKLGFPEIYSDAKIYDAMFYAGAVDVKSITCNAWVQWSAAHKFIEGDPSDDWLVALDAAKVPDRITLQGSSGFQVTYRDPGLGTEDATYAIAGPRNLTFLVDKERIRFKEVVI